METCWSSEIDPILGVGLPLMAQGINNWALDGDQALAAVGELGRRGIAVLGGAVFVRNDRDGRDLRPSPDTWACSQQASESPEGFAQRSCQAAAEYIARYHRKSLEETPLFALLPRADGR